VPLDKCSIVSILLSLGARRDGTGAQDRSWEAVKQIIPAIGECDSLTADRLSSFTTGRRS
jgi:hypothetical protein